MTEEKTPVMPAKPYKPCQLGSFGKASYMFLRQYNFPSEYNFPDEKIETADSDRLEHSYVNNCFKKYISNGERGFENWILQKSTTDEIILSLVKEMLNVHGKYTGYRVIGGVNGGGYAIWTFQLFMKTEISDTKLYTNSGMFSEAPNIIDK